MKSPKALAAREAQALALNPKKGCQLFTADDVHSLLLPQLKNLEQECFWVIAVNCHNQIIGFEMIAKGTVHSVEVNPRDVFRYAVRTNAAAIIVSHNHPSGDCTPSREDYILTERLKEAGNILGIPLVDHVVVHESTYCTMSV